MKKFIIILAVAAVLLAGCNGVWLNAEYSGLLDKTVSLSEASAVKAEADQLSTDNMKAILRLQADTWRKFQQGRDGEDGK